MAKGLFINYFEAAGLDPSDSREKNYEILREKHSEWAGKPSDRARVQADILNQAMETFHDEEKYQEFIKEYQEYQRRAQKRATGDQAEVRVPERQGQSSAWEPGTDRRQRGRSSRLRVFVLLFSMAAVIGGVIAGTLIIINARANPLRGLKPVQTFANSDGSSVQTVAISRDGTLLAIGSTSDYISLWNIKSEDRVVTFTAPVKGSNYSIESAAFSPSGKLLAAGDSNGHTYVWNISSHQITANIADPASSDGGVTAVAFSPNGRLLAMGDYNGTTYLWNVAAKSRDTSLAYSNVGNGGIGAVAFNADGSILASGDKDNANTYLSNPATRRNIGVLSDAKSTSSGVTALAFSPDGKKLATVDSSGSTYLWDIASQSMVATIAIQGCQAVAFSPNGKMLAIGDSSGDTHLWTLANMHEIGALVDPRSLSGGIGVNSLAFSPDSDLLVTGDQSGAAYLWRLSQLPPD